MTEAQDGGSGLSCWWGGWSASKGQDGCPFLRALSFLTAPIFWLSLSNTISSPHQCSLPCAFSVCHTHYPLTLFTQVLQIFQLCVSPHASPNHILTCMPSPHTASNALNQPVLLLHSPTMLCLLTHIMSMPPFIPICPYFRSVAFSLFLFLSLEYINSGQ